MYRGASLPLQDWSHSQHKRTQGQRNGDGEIFRGHRKAEDKAQVSQEKTRC